MSKFIVIIYMILIFNLIVNFKKYVSDTILVNKCNLILLRVNLKSKLCEKQKDKTKIRTIFSLL